MKKIIIIVILMSLSGTAALAQAGAVAPDISRISSGARTLGMGKTFAGLGDDVYSLFLNPAGISQIDRWQVSSMSGKIIDFNYLTFAGIYPTNAGNLGLGLSSASIGGAYKTKVKAGTENTSDPIYEYDVAAGTIGYFNNVFLFSYGGQVGQLMSLPVIERAKDQLKIFKDIRIGANLKFFSSGLSNIANAAGTGNELDLGLMTDIRPFLKVGFTAANLLPYSMGGKLTYTANHAESYPVNTKLGFSLNVLGRRDSLRTADQDLKLLLDLETYPTRKRYPLVMHLGAEWTPVSILSLRAGIDQDAAEDINGNISSISNLTAGVGLTYQQFRFDFAYHQFAGVTGSDNYFFSLTYGLPVEKAKYDVLDIVSPKDKLITSESAVQVKGSIKPPARYAAINKIPAGVSKAGVFSESLGLAVSKNRITIEAQDLAKKTLDSRKLRLLRLRSFPDVPAGKWSAEPISYISTLGIIEGYPTGAFKPEGNITRAELTAVLMRTGKATTEAGLSLFKDVRLSHWAGKYILPAVKTGVVKGYPDSTFRPSANISRAEGLAMIARFSRVTQEAGATPYVDVPSSHWAAPIIKGSYRAGMLQYLGQKPFEANKKLTREEAVEMLFRSPYVQDLLRKDLLNWETY